MGNQSSRPRDNKNRKLLREKKMHENADKVRSQTNQWLTNKKHSTALTTLDLQEATMLQTMQQQVDRGDKPLTKSDLIAILIRLDPKCQMDAISIHNSLTTKDIIALIRGVIYTSSSTSQESKNALDNKSTTSVAPYLCV